MSLSNETITDDVLADISDEHEQLNRMFTHISEELASPGPNKLGVIRELFHILAGQLQQHFAHEEEGGYFSEIIEASPRLAARVESLKQQHITMQASVNEICRQLKHAEYSPVWFQAINLGYNTFLQNCREHEACEDRLVQEAYLQDIGALD